MAHGVDGLPPAPRHAAPTAPDPAPSPAAPAVAAVPAGRAPRRAPRLPDIDTGRCTGCGWCVAACDLHLLSLEVVRWRKTSVLHEPGRCTGCSLCALRCPFRVITMRAPVASDDASPVPPDRPEPSGSSGPGPRTTASMQWPSESTSKQA